MSSTLSIQDSSAAASVPPQPKRSSLLGDDFAPVCFTFLASLGFLDLLISCISKWYRPDTAYLIRKGTELVIPAVARTLAPEPVERLQYVLGLLLTPLFLFACLLGLKRLYRATPEAGRRIYTWVATTLLLAGTFATPVLTYHALDKSDFLYVRASLLFTHWLAYTLLFFPSLALLVYFAHKRWILWVGRVALYTLSTYIAVIAFFSVLFDRDSISPWTHHLNSVIYPLAQVMAGKTLLVDCAPLYGLYPHFLQPLFKIFPLGVYSLTLVMASLLVVCLAGVWLFLRMVTRNRFVFLAVFTAVAFYSYVAPKTVRPKVFGDPYFQYWPIRVLFPSLLLALASLYLRGFGKRWIYYAGFLCSALATLWNPDTGLVVFGTWFLLLAYTELFRNSWRASARPILWHALTAVGALLLVYGGYALFAFLRSGVWPDWRMSANYYKIFSYYGLVMLPMAPLPHVWGIMVAAYVAAMVVAIHGLLRKENELLCGSLFILAILGAGLFGYYNGRSHDFCIIPLLYVPLLIITLLADHLFVRLKQGDRACYKCLPLGLLFFYLCASAVPSVFAAGELSQFKGWIQAGSSVSIDGSRGTHTRNIKFIRAQTKRGERIFIFLRGNIEGVYYAESGTASVLDLPSSTDSFFKSDTEKIVNFLRQNKSTKLFVVPGQYAGLDASFKRYRIAAREGQTGMVMLLPAEDAVPAGIPTHSELERDP